MGNTQKPEPSIRGWSEMSVRFVGQFIFWAIMSLVGWSFYHTLKHETAIILLEHRLNTLEETVKENHHRH